MEFKTALFYILSAILIVAALRVITSRNPVHAVLFLVLAFFNASGIWFLLQAEFLAIALVVVYVGAVMVLFLFVVMMLDVNATVAREGFTRYAALGGLIAAIVVGELLALLWLRSSGLPITQPLASMPDGHSNTREIGLELFGGHVFEFELAAFLLLLAIVAAIMLTHRQRPGLKYQDVSAQVKVRREDRVRLIKMAAERDE